jgi:type I restriction enzyme R subunit
VQAALATAQASGITRSEDTLLPEEIAAARAARVAAACAPFDQPELRDEIENARREREQLIDHINLDQVTFAGFSEQAEAQAKAVIQTFADYLKQHKDEIAALDFFYQQPYQRRALTFEMIEELHEHLSKPPLMLTTERLWSAYARVQASAGERRGQANASSPIWFHWCALRWGWTANSSPSPTKWTSASKPGSSATTPSAAPPSRPSRPNGCA